MTYAITYSINRNGAVSDEQVRKHSRQAQEVVESQYFQHNRATKPGSEGEAIAFLK